jgi:hypothetical protein
VAYILTRLQVVVSVMSAEVPEVACTLGVPGVARVSTASKPGVRKAVGSRSRMASAVALVAKAAVVSCAAVNGPLTGTAVARSCVSVRGPDTAKVPVPALAVTVPDTGTAVARSCVSVRGPLTAKVPLPALAVTVPLTGTDVARSCVSVRGPLTGTADWLLATVTDNEPAMLAWPRLAGSSAINEVNRCASRINRPLMPAAAVSVEGAVVFV